jgi:polar amino acid transport system substrate-binding protein
VNIGTSYIQDMQQLSSSVCAGKPAIKEITVGGTIADQELQIRTGRAIAAVTAPENIGYLGTISPGNWVPVGKVFATAPYGIAVAKTNTGLLNALDGAMKDIVSDGTYAKIAKRWNLVPSEVHSVTINAGL